MKIKQNLIHFLFIGLLVVGMNGCNDQDATVQVAQKSGDVTSRNLEHNNRSGNERVMDRSDSESNREVAAVAKSQSNQGDFKASSTVWSRLHDTARHGGKVAGEMLVFVSVVLACMVALFISILSFSGAWLVLLAAIVSLLLVGVPGWWTVLVFLALSIGGEVMEAFSSFHGVKKRGGSKLAAVSGFIGAIVGGIIGAALIPVVGALIGLLVGTFLGVFGVEWQRLRHSGHASHIAWGAFFARLSVIFVKVISVFIMSGWLIWQLGVNLF